MFVIKKEQREKERKTENGRNEKKNEKKKEQKQKTYCCWCRIKCYSHLETEAKSLMTMKVTIYGNLYSANTVSSVPGLYKSPVSFLL